MKINKKQVKALELLISNMGEMTASERTDNDGSKFIECECAVMNRSYIINIDGECYNDRSELLVDEDGEWLA